MKKQEKNSEKVNVIHLKDRMKNGIKKLSPNSLWSSLRNFFARLWNGVRVTVQNPIFQYVLLIFAWSVFVHSVNLVLNSAWLAALPATQFAIALAIMAVVFTFVTYITIKMIVMLSLDIALFTMAWFEKREKNDAVTV